MSRIDRVNEKIKNGGVLLGTQSVMPSPEAVEMLGSCGYDVLWIDTEHSPIDIRTLNLMIMAANLSDIAVFVRVPENNPNIVKPILDAGADGIIFPNIRSVEEAKKAVASLRYYPDGIRGYGPERVLGYGKIDEQEYIHKESFKTWAILQIEDVHIVDDLEDIMTVPGIGSMMIGPADFSGSMGKLMHFDDPELNEMYEIVVKKANKVGVPIGTCCGPNMVERFLKWGVNWVNVGADAGFIIGGARSLRAELEKSVELYHK